jgi:hypothetical protein
MGVKRVNRLTIYRRSGRENAVLGLVALGLSLAVSGCKMNLSETAQSEAAVLATASSVSRNNGLPPREMKIAGGAITVSGPRGYCIDRAASSMRAEDQAVVVLSSCRELGGGFLSPAPEVAAILTVAVASADIALDLPAATPALQRLFTTDAGRALLSRAGTARSVTVHESFGAEDAFMVRLTDTSPFPGGEVGADYWRAIFSLGGRAVTVSAYGGPGQTLQRNEGIRLLRDFILSIRSAST